MDITEFETRPDVCCDSCGAELDIGVDWESLQERFGVEESLGA